MRDQQVVEAPAFHRVPEFVFLSAWNAIDAFDPFGEQSIYQRPGASVQATDGSRWFMQMKGARRYVL